MTTSGWKSFNRAVSSGTLSASTPAVRMGRESSAAMASHLDLVREASMISLKTSGSWAHLWVTTRPTPPAPMMRVLDMRRFRIADCGLRIADCGLRIADFWKADWRTGGVDWQGGFGDGFYALRLVAMRAFQVAAFSAKERWGSA